MIVSRLDPQIEHRRLHARLRLGPALDPRLAMPAGGVLDGELYYLALRLRRPVHGRFQSILNIQVVHFRSLPVVCPRQFNKTVEFVATDERHPRLCGFGMLSRRVLRPLFALIPEEDCAIYHWGIKGNISVLRRRFRGGARRGGRGCGKPAAQHLQGRGPGRRRKPLALQGAPRQTFRRGEEAR